MVAGFCATVAVGRPLEAESPPAEYAAKAASLAWLIEYIKWPAGVTFDTLGIVGDDPFGAALEKVKTRHAKSIEELKDCQIVFVPKSESANVETILNSVGTANVLTAGDSEGFAKNGGVIGLVMEEGKVRFEINTAAARRAGIGIDLRVLKLALHVFND
ncbi:MAG TPA: YfiR family protein [Chthoniobacteraceae bacterium]|nr:YfiR family protein [Chthoniobacteraceae bacterium]